MKIFLEHNVYEGALARIRYLFNEFENLYVNFSGGKDSTVLLKLTIQVATEMGRLPVKAMFLDQECEWECVIEFMRRTAKRDEVEFSWLQVPTVQSGCLPDRVDGRTCHSDGFPNRGLPRCRCSVVGPPLQQVRKHES